MTIELLQLRLFLEVIAAGSVSAAARRTNIVQSALSRRMQMLESSLGTSLFLRHAVGITLTDAGKRLQVHAETILEQYDALKREFDLLRGGSGAEVKLGITKSLAPLFQRVVAAGVPGVLPDVSLRLLDATGRILHDWLLSREIDLAVMTDWRTNSAFEYYPLWSERLFLVMPPGVSDNFQSALNAMEQLPFIATLSTDELVKASKTLAARIDCAGPRLQMDSIPSVLQLVESGVGFTIQPYFAVCDELNTQRLRVSPLPESIPRYLVRRASTPLVGSVHQVMSLLPKILMRELGSTEWVQLIGSGQSGRWTKDMLLGRGSMKMERRQATD